MEIGQYINLFWKQKWVIVATTITAFSLAFIYSQTLSPIYRSYATLRFQTALVGDTSWVDYNIDYTERIINTYSILATSGPIRSTIMDQLSIDILPEITIESIPLSELISITAESDDPQLATDVANIIGEILTQQEGDLFIDDVATAQETLQGVQDGILQEINNLQQQYAGLLEDEPTSASDEVLRLININVAEYDAIESQVNLLNFIKSVRSNQVLLIERAVVPTSPEGPNRTIFLILGLVGGFVGGIALAIVLNLLDNKIYSSSEFTKLLSPTQIIGKIPATSKKSINQIYDKSSETFERESFRRAGAQLAQILEQASDRAPIILVTSAIENEDTSTTVAGLAYALTEYGLNPLVIDTDVRNPSLHTSFNLKNTKGLSDFIKTPNNTTLDNIIQQEAHYNVDVITTGPRLTTTDTLSPKIRLLFDAINQKGAEYDVILIDSASYLAMSDATLIAVEADAVVGVVYRGRSMRTELSEMVKQLQELEIPIIGFIENNADLYKERAQFRKYQTQVKKA